MPTYEYQCFACSHRFEVFQKISDVPIGVCPKCQANSGNVKRLLSAAPFHLKGSGWYKTDYSGSSSGSKPVSTESSKQESDSGESNSTEAKSSDTSSTATVENTTTSTVKPSDTKGDV